uniref:Reverse transcriptase domain-containing protein n=1 Tax=Amphiprion percula TaxID=161767 RepID=A0A3P8RXI2_AMPPE
LHVGTNRQKKQHDKAFDSIQHKAVFKALKQHGVEDNYINILKETYDGSFIIDSIMNRITNQEVMLENASDK